MAELVSQSLALFLSWLFARAAWHKLRHSRYYSQLLQSWWSPRPLARLLVWPVAAMEASLVLALLLPVTRNMALILSAALLLCYAAVMAWQLLHGRGDLKCGCAGPARDTTISAALVWRNLICALAAMLAVNPLSSVPALVLNVSHISLSIGLAVFTCLLYLCCEQLLDNAQHFALEKR